MIFGKIEKNTSPTTLNPTSLSLTLRKIDPIVRINSMHIHGANLRCKDVGKKEVGQVLEINIYKR
jgi:hypothetical protein